MENCFSPSYHHGNMPFHSLKWHKIERERENVSWCIFDRETGRKLHCIAFLRWLICMLNIPIQAHTFRYCLYIFNLWFWLLLLFYTQHKICEVDELRQAQGWVEMKFDQNESKVSQIMWWLTTKLTIFYFKNYKTHKKCNEHKML